MARTDVEFADITVLVVDDQDYVRSIVAQLLRRLGVGHVLESSNGSDALQILERSKPDVILCDIKMQPVDGLQFLHDVRGGIAGANPNVPIIFLTSASDRATVQAAIEGDVDGYLVKPVSAEELKTKMRAVLARRIGERGISWKSSV
jgi:two-component system chemotaxis response regulator CheY